VLFIFAGKAHPADEPGRELIRQIAELSHKREFEGRILLVEGYDLHLARRMVAGVDVWLNNPIYPLEASGTSGMKAAINGAINLSVLDGWWGEGYDGGNGWAIKPAAEGLDPSERDADEARTLYELLQDSVIPMYYRSTSLGYSPEWVAMAKQSIASIMPRFNMQRMLTDYVEKFYSPAAEQWRRYAGDGFSGARQRRRVEGTGTRRLAARRHPPPRPGGAAHPLRRNDALRSGGPARRPDPGRPGGRDGVYPPWRADHRARARRYALKHERALGNGEHLFARELTPDQCGKMEYRVRVYPTHEAADPSFRDGHDALAMKRAAMTPAMSSAWQDLARAAEDRQRNAACATCSPPIRIASRAHSIDLERLAARLLQAACRCEHVMDAAVRAMAGGRGAGLDRAHARRRGRSTTPRAAPRCTSRFAIRRQRARCCMHGQDVMPAVHAELDKMRALLRRDPQSPLARQRPASRSATS
jgi:hypothetical protein